MMTDSPAARQPIVDPLTGTMYGVNMPCVQPSLAPSVRVKPYDLAKRLADLADRERICWEMAGLFLRQRDPHGLHDIGVEIEGLRRAMTELRALSEAGAG